MALSEYYKENATWMYHYNCNNLDIAVSPTLETMLTDDNSLDLSVLLNNGSTFSQLNTGYYGVHPAVYPAADNTSMITNYTAGVQYLGSALIVTNLNGGYTYSTHAGCLINLTTKQGMNVKEWGYYGWDNVKDVRFILNTRPHKTGTSTGQAVDWSTVTDWMSLKRFVLKPWYNYVDINQNFLTVAGRANNFDDIPVDRHNMMAYAEYNVWLSNYDEHGSESTMTDNKQMCGLVFFFNINGEIWMTDHPEQCYPIGRIDQIPTYQPQTVPPGYSAKYVGIGEFNKTENVALQLPTSSDEKGWRFAACYVSNAWRQCAAYVNAISAMYYFVNSTGLRWSDRKAGIGTFGDYRQTIRLGVMDRSGIIKHDEWIVGEEKILASSNPNKRGDYTNLPERPESGGGGDTNIDLDPNDVVDTMPNVSWASFGRYYLVDSDIMGKVIKFVSNQASDSIYNKILGVHASFIGVEGDRGESPIKIGGLTVTDDEGSAVIAEQVTVPIKGIQLGNFKVHTYYNDFRDYLTQYELYLPLVGWINISSVVTLGHIIDIRLSVDVVSGDAQYNLKDRTTGAHIETIPCTFGFDIPVSSSGEGQLKIARSNMVAGAISTLGQGLMNWRFGDFKHSYTKVNSAVELTGGFVNEFNNWATLASTSFANSTGVAPYAMIQSACSPTVILRITRVEDYIPEGYGHTTGFVCDKVETLSDMSGFTVCDNVDCSGIVCTDTEKAMIKTMLESGVYL